MNVLVGLMMFLGLLAALVLFWRKLGGQSFWNLTAVLPDQAFEWFTKDPAWVVIESGDPSPGSAYAGPFRLYVPRLRRTVNVYGLSEKIEDSQRRFIARHSHARPATKAPIWSAIFLLYPMYATLYLAKTPAPPLYVLGVALSNLGYLVLAACLVVGHFRVLGLEGRLPTLISAVVFWLGGVFLVNVAR